MRIFKQFFIIQITIEITNEVLIEIIVKILVRLRIYLKYFSFRVFKNIIFIFYLKFVIIIKLLI